ncbi:MAG: hypothetical protein O2973_05220 [Gemmatimonadetes bacterium]|nr:hypothetical protein [Gemmatimonadota bacterium]
MQGTSGLAVLTDVQAPAPGVATPTSAVQGAGAAPAPLTVAELRARRSEISSQIGNITDRRDEIASQLRAATPGADQAGLAGRLVLLDSRIAELETDLNVTGRQLADARGNAAGTSQDPPGPQTSMPNDDQITGIAIVFTLAVLMPLSIAWARAIFRRGKHAAEQPSAHLIQRLDRMEEGIDAIAIEVERISEGQRFVTKVLGEGAAPAISAGRGGAQPVAVPRGEPVEVARGR